MSPCLKGLSGYALDPNIDSVVYIIVSDYAVPEPATLTLVGGTAFLCLMLRRRKTAKI